MSRIVLAESDAAERARIHQELSRVGHDVDSVRSLDEAVHALSMATAAEVLLSGLAGLEAVRLVELGRKVSPTTRSVLVTDPASGPEAREAMAHGAVSVLTRPIAYDELHDAVATASECGVGFYGFFHGLSLLDLLQIFHVAKRSVRVRIGGTIEGCLYLRRGELVHADAGEMVGVDALAVLLTGTDTGWVQTLPLGEAFADTIAAHFDGLLLDVLRQSDERQREPAWTMPPMDFMLDEAVEASSFPPPEEVFDNAEQSNLTPTDAQNGSMVDPSLNEHVATWLRQCRAAGTLTTTVQVVAVAMSSGDSVTLQGGIDSERVADAAIELHDVVARLTGDASAAVVEYTTDRGGVVVCWDSDQRSLLALGEEIQVGSVTTWFRWRGSALGRAFAPQLYPGKHDE